METSLHGSGQLDYEIAPSQDDKTTPTSEAIQAGPSNPQNTSLQLEPTQVDGASGSVGGAPGNVNQGLAEVEQLKTDMASVWGMSRDSPHNTVTTGTPSHPHTPPESHTDMELEPELKPPAPSSPPHTTHTTNDVTPPHPHTVTNDNMLSTADNPVAMETDDATNTQTNQQSNTSAVVAVATEQQISAPWFSLTPRSPCETKPSVAMATALPNGIPEGQFQLVSTTTGGQLGGGMMQYYLTPSGAVAAAPAQVGYALVGNTLVPQQFLAGQQQLLISQGGVQYVVGGGAGGLMGLGGMAMVQGAEGGAVLQAVGGEGVSLVMSEKVTGAGENNTLQNHVAQATPTPARIDDVVHNQPQQAAVTETKPISPVATNGEWIT